MEGFLFQATIYLLAAVLAVPVATRLGLGSVLGYLLAGILIGPVLGLVGSSETEDLQHFAEFGVVMMLFLIGLELEPRSLWGMRRNLVGLGGLQVTVTAALVTMGALALGLDWNEAIAVGLVLALSSTAIVLQTLSEKNLMRTQGGRSTFSVLLTQDIAVIPMLALLPLLAVSRGGAPAEAGHAEEHPAMSLVEGLPGWGVTLVTLAAVGAVILTGLYLVRPAFHFIDKARLREMYTAFALLIVVGIATLMNMVGLSPALGAFMAGVVLASSEFRHELESDIEPFKGLLLGLFFITVGAGISFPALFEAPLMLLGLTLMVMAVKGGVLWVLATVFKLRGRDRWLFTLGLAQAGEFGFVLVSFARQQSVVPGALAETLLLVVALSMLLTPLFFIAYELLSRRHAASKDEPPPDQIDQRHPVIIAGIGRFGQVVNRMLQSTGIPTTVLDRDLEAVTLMRRFGFKGFFGDPTRREILEAAGLAEAQVLVVALDDPASAIRLTRVARRARPDLRIIARARDRVHVYQLYRAGADDIVREVFDSALRTGRYALEAMGLSDFEAHERSTAFYHADRAALRELAELWKPGLKITDNPAYMERARELNRDLETAIVTQLDRRAEERAAAHHESRSDAA